jgi:hypothetical protein
MIECTEAMDAANLSTTDLVSAKKYEEDGGSCAAETKGKTEGSPLGDIGALVPACPGFTTGNTVSFSNATLPVLAVIVKAATKANVYDYSSTETGSASNLVTPTLQNISHVTFCFGPPVVSPPVGRCTLSRRCDLLLSFAVEHLASQ